jgi:TM2 domain-containing membrane protein YozV
MGKWTAAILSLLFMGLGQFYAGHFWRALCWFFGSILVVAFLTMLTGIGGFIVAPILWIGCSPDAYNLVE